MTRDHVDFGVAYGTTETSWHQVEDLPTPVTVTAVASQGFGVVRVDRTTVMVPMPRDEWPPEWKMRGHHPPNPLPKVPDVTDTDVDASIPATVGGSTPLIYRVSARTDLTPPCVRAFGSLMVIDGAGKVLRTWQLSYVKGPEITFDRRSITVRQGEAFEVGFHARSASGQPQHFTLEAPGWGSVVVDIPPNATVTGKLLLTVPTDVGVGTTAMPVTTVPFGLKGVIAGATADGTTIPATIGVTVTPAQASVIVVGSSAISAAPGTTVPVTIDLSLNQTTSNTTIVVEPYLSPFASIPGRTFELNNSDWVQNGIPFVRHTRNLDASGTQRGQISLVIPPDTAGCAKDTTVRVKWSAYDGKQTGEFDLALTVPYPEITFDAPIVSGGLAALGGHVWVTLRGDGTVEWKGHAHDSGADGYDFTVNAIVPGPAGVAVALTHSGHVGGTVTAGARDHDWDNSIPTASCGTVGRPWSRRGCRRISSTRVTSGKHLSPCWIGR